MPVILNAKNQVFRPYSYENEAEFEADVVKLAEQIFGQSSLYVDIKKRMGNDILSIPDGYLIDVTEQDNPKLFIVENEIVNHDPFKHIGIQMLKFVTSFDEAHRQIRSFLMDSIRRNTKLLAKLEIACKQSSSPNIDHYLDRAVYREFKGLVVIDEARPELYRVLEKINANISVLELKAFHAGDGERLFQFDTLYDEFEDGPNTEEQKTAPSMTVEERAARRVRRASSDTIIVPAREDGFQEEFLGHGQWYAIRIGAAMKDRLKYIAAYRVAPISAVTHIAEILEIKPYKDTGKYLVSFKGPAQEIPHLKLAESRKTPQGPIYVLKEKLIAAKTLDEAMKA